MKIVPFCLRPLGSLLTMALCASGFAGCSSQTDPFPARALAELRKKTQSQLIFVQGGEFKMGDFGEIHTPDNLQYSIARDDGPLHTVLVSDFAIQKYKVTLGDFRVFTATNGLPPPYEGTNQNPGQEKVLSHPRVADIPVGVPWSTAKSYCQWIGKEIGRKMDLPTEADWEYAARSRGALAAVCDQHREQRARRQFPHARADQERNWNERGHDAGRDVATQSYGPT